MFSPCEFEFRDPSSTTRAGSVGKQTALFTPATEAKIAERAVKEDDGNRMEQKGENHCRKEQIHSNRRRGTCQDSLLRVNFLSRAAQLILKTQPHNVELARYYTKCLLDVKKKKTLKLDPAIKKKLCRRCNMLLLPGSTARVRIRDGKRAHIARTCLTCNSVSRAFSRRRSTDRRMRYSKQQQSVSVRTAIQNAP